MMDSPERARTATKFPASPVRTASMAVAGLSSAVRREEVFDMNHSPFDWDKAIDEIENELAGLPGIRELTPITVADGKGNTLSLTFDRELAMLMVDMDGPTTGQWLPSVDMPKRLHASALIGPLIQEYVRMRDELPGEMRQLGENLNEALRMLRELKR